MGGRAASEARAVALAALRAFFPKNLDRLKSRGNYQDMTNSTQRLRSLLILPLQFALLGICACDEGVISPGDTSNVPGVGGTNSGAEAGSSSGMPGMPGTAGPGDTSGASTPESKIVPGEGDCPDAAALLAAPKIPRRELHVGSIQYRASDAKKPHHRVIKTAMEYGELQKELKLTLPEVDFSKERVLFGSVIEYASCFMEVEALRTVTINGNFHVDFSAVENRGGAACNQACGLVDEKAFVVALEGVGDKTPTICTRKRIHCRDQ